MATLEQIRINIMPVPQKLETAQGAALKLGRNSKFTLTAPTAEYGPVKTAGEKLAAYLQENCGENCLDGGIPVTLTLGEAPADMPNPTEGYALKIDAEGIDLVGFGPRGLLYGVYTIMQCCMWENGTCEIPALTLLDWPDSRFRGIKEESRYGSNMMEREDWMALLEDVARRKLNFMGLALYGCWTVQYSGKLAEFLYLPIKNYPQIETPMEVRYYDPETNTWIDCEQLPPIFRDNLLDDIFRKARDLGIEIMPSWNSYGHNTLLPRMIPSISAKEEDGVTPTEFGFCTSSEETFEVLFSIYDQIIDDYMKPYGMKMMTPLLDEVHAGTGKNAKRPFDNISPFCQCAKCREKDYGQMFIDMTVRITQYLKSKGMTSIILANDMLKHDRAIPGLSERLQKALQEADLMDVLLLGWWCYTDVERNLKFKDMDPQSGLRNLAAPWTGYHNWNMVYHPLENIRLMAKMNHEDKGEGLNGYSNWDRSCDRNYDCLADYGWNYEGAGATEDVTRRYVQRNYPKRYEEALRAYRLMDFCTEQRPFITKEGDDKRIISNFELLLYKLGYYNYTYVVVGQPHPRNYPGEAVSYLLHTRKDMERALYGVSAMAKEAAEILLDLSKDESCNRPQALRMYYECMNYLNLSTDFLTLLRMHDLSQTGDYATIAKLARQRQAARVEQIKLCKQAKETFICKALTLRNLSIYMQMFCDIADHIEATENPSLDFTDLMPIMSQKSLHLR